MAFCGGLTFSADPNYERIKYEVVQIVENEKRRIMNDPDLKHLIKEE
jgi:hypothetical protein